MDLVIVTNIEKDTLSNKNYRKVIYTNDQIQIALMTLYPNEDIPKERHAGSQFIRVEAGNGIITIDQNTYILYDGMCAVVPPHTWHYVRNTSSNTPLQLYTIYSPPEHEVGLIQYNPE